jgi:DNA-binding transcriptional ArsR family regulator
MSLRSIRAARPGEFPDIEKERGSDLRTLLLELLADQGPLTATEAAASLGYSRPYISSLLARLEQEGKVKGFRVGHQVLYGLPPATASLDLAQEFPPEEES